MIDFHSHLLPMLDDGSKSEEETRQMLALYPKEVTDVVLTPHFYPDRDQPEEFLAARAHSFRVAAACFQNTGIRPMLGAEVAYYDGIAQSECIGDFTVEDSNLLLVEMPIGPWHKRMFDNLFSLMDRGIRPVLAHLDRYGLLAKVKDPLVRDYLAQGGLVQLNCSVFDSVLSRTAAVRMLEKGSAHFLGTDCHNMDSRKPNIAKALEYLEKHPQALEALKYYENRYIIRRKQK